MAKRVTIVIDEKLEKKIRNIQAKRIATEHKSVSFSQVLNELLKEGFKS